MKFLGLVYIFTLLSMKGYEKLNYCNEELLYVGYLATFAGFFISFFSSYIGIFFTLRRPEKIIYCFFQNVINICFDKFLHRITLNLMVYFHSSQTNIANLSNNINLRIVALLVSKSHSFIFSYQLVYIYIETA